MVVDTVPCEGLLRLPAFLRGASPYIFIARNSFIRAVLLG